MAAGKQNSKELKKRKRTPGPKGKERESNPKKFKPNSTTVPEKGPRKPFKSSKHQPPTKQHEAKPFVQKDSKVSKKEGRLQAKKLAEARKKKRKKHFTLEQELNSLWAKIRRRDIAEEDKSNCVFAVISDDPVMLVTEALNKMKGKIPEIASSHVSSRVLQACVKHCSEDERALVFLELRPHFIAFATNTYAVHLVTKMLDHATKDQLGEFISSLHGHVAALLRHAVGSLVIEQAFNLGNSSQKQALLTELFSPELKLFKGLVSMNKIKDAASAKIDGSQLQAHQPFSSSTSLNTKYRLIDIISNLKLQKSSVLRHMTSVLQPILEKGILDHSIIHRAIMEYFTIADQSSAADVILQLSGPSLVRMVHTKDGSRIAMLCLRHGSAKERKKIVKGMKDQVEKIARDKCGVMVLVSILSTVDDTKLLSKIILRELEGKLKELVLDQNGRRPLLQLLHPNCSRYFSPDDLMSLSLSIPSLSDKSELETSSVFPPKVEASQATHMSEEDEKGNTGIADESTTSKIEGEIMQQNEAGKKDPLTRRKELLIDSGFAEKLSDACCEMAGDMLRSKFGNEVMYEVVTGGSDRLLYPTLKGKLAKLHEAIAALVAEPKSEGAEENHLLEHFFSSRTIRKLVLECPDFASTLWEKALKGKGATWAQGHSAKVISAFMEASDHAVVDMTKNELQPLIDSGLLKLPAKKETAPKKRKAADAQQDANAE